MLVLVKTQAPSTRILIYESVESNLYADDDKNAEQHIFAVFELDWGLHSLFDTALIHSIWAVNPFDTRVNDHMKLLFKFSVF